MTTPVEPNPSFIPPLPSDTSTLWVGAFPLFLHLSIEIFKQKTTYAYTKANTLLIASTDVGWEKEWGRASKRERERDRDREKKEREEEKKERKRAKERKIERTSNKRNKNNRVTRKRLNKDVLVIAMKKITENREEGKNTKRKRQKKNKESGRIEDTLFRTRTLSLQLKSLVRGTKINTESWQSKGWNWIFRKK